MILSTAESSPATKAARRGTTEKPTMPSTASFAILLREYLDLPAKRGEATKGTSATL